MSTTRPNGAPHDTRRARGAYLRVVRWLDAPRLVRTRRRRRAALTAAALAAGTAMQAIVSSTAPQLAPCAHQTPALPCDPRLDAPFAFTLRTTVATPLAGTRVVLRLDVVNSAGWRAVLSVHLEPTPIHTTPLWSGSRLPVTYH
jgi:hypothetical protein